ncbi:MAG TPA: hypothetical protein DIT19_04420 [Desulfonauticus sp.]|jgi:XXXCH domain-containing protein|nr:MAG: Uncharacterized protein XD41_0420 [Desulfonauticus sp. 38_4375]MDK2921101.1 hypothetical protein [Desulfonauticus sp.]HCO12452.1 hypothetical protein [Desulfonauticus sp.]
MDLKEYKKKLSQAFFELKKSTRQGELPPLPKVENFYNLAQKLTHFASEDWLEEAEDFVILAKQLKQAVQKGNPRETLMLINSLSEARSYCHKTFK